jgi:hypothetical protein
MPKKILIPEGKPFKKTKTYPVAGRIEKDTYDKLQEIFSQTFLSSSQVIGEIINFAIEYVEVVDAGIYFKNKR